MRRRFQSEVVTQYHLTSSSEQEESWKGLNHECQKYILMDKIVDQAKAQLMLIERIYGLKIINRDEVAGLIASNVDNNRQVLTICSSELLDSSQ